MGFAGINGKGVRDEWDGKRVQGAVVILDRMGGEGRAVRP